MSIAAIPRPPPTNISNSAVLITTGPAVSPATAPVPPVAIETPKVASPASPTAIAPFFLFCFFFFMVHPTNS